jgi:phosphoenolpyruvate carboxykinase (GTP)
MTTTIIGLDKAPTTHSKLLGWVRSVAELTQPERIEWVTGTPEEWTRITDLLVEGGTFKRLNADKKPNSFISNSDPSDVARVEDRTFICSVNQIDAGPTNNWMDPADMKAILTERFRGSMRGRTLYVLPYCMGPLDAEKPMLGVELTDSAYVVASMHIMARLGTKALELFTKDGVEQEFVSGLHSVGAPLEPGQADVAWPSNETKYIVHFPEERAIWSYGSGYGGNALLGKKCHSLRIASVQARDEGWMAEHMLIAKITSPEGKVSFIGAGFPSQCGKTNLAMLQSQLPGWKLETVGDDIAWIRVGKDGRFYAVNPEFGFFGVAPGTDAHTNPNAIATINKGNSIFTNVAVTDDGDVWWEGLGQAPAHLIDWKGNDWTPESGTPAAQPNSRYATPMAQCDTKAPEWNDPQGVPLDAIFFGGRRKGTVPLVTESKDWQQGVFLASILSSETTAAATGAVGVVRRDPMAMLPFIGYNAGDYVNHWFEMGKHADASKLPKIFYVNWFRRDENNKFVWPGYGENLRVIKWALERIAGTAGGVETPIGFVPAAGSLDVSGLDISEDAVAKATTVVPEEWKAEIPLIEEWFDSLGERLPSLLRDELATLKQQLGA